MEHALVKPPCLCSLTFCSLPPILDSSTHIFCWSLESACLWAFLLPVEIIYLFSELIPTHSFVLLRRFTPQRSLLPNERNSFPSSHIRPTSCITPFSHNLQISVTPCFLLRIASHGSLIVCVIIYVQLVFLIKL